ncbi:hypothetical protein BJ322DRAFT_1113407 [Thelephora terrestris]|uniref:F-box domain-containing protein n=1 Tax=Thelephora terrestris TaxID=56493 RepID=A0A9P6L2M2_9AGAM|nr:hypothetical protein BJ322DRAFT_1113407 [Thelephora terrestris]
MNLPPELIDQILDDLSDDLESLRAAALVSKAWASWCQAHLFKSVHLTPHTLNGWFKNVPHEVGGPASLTRTLTLEESYFMSWINPQFMYFPLSNLTTFSDVRSLSFIKWDAILFRGASLKPYFGHFGTTLRAVSLRSCGFHPAILFDLLSLLPNVDDLEIERPHTHSKVPDTIPDAPKITPSFRGTLSLADLSAGTLILKAIATLPLHFSTIKINGCLLYELGAYQMLLTSCRDTLVTLHLEESNRGLTLPDVSLASCNELEEVHALFLGFMKLPRSPGTPFSSITSRKLRKISLTFAEDGNPHYQNEPGWDESEWSVWGARPIPWGSWDTVLSHLAHQARGAGGRLTLQLNVRRVGPKPPKLDHLLPRFLGDGGLVDINCN